MHMDGTFKVCSKIFYQLYVIHSSSAHDMLPELFCLLPDKKTATHHRLFSLLKAKADGLGLNFNLKSIMVDFEFAVHNVIRLVMSSTLIRRCSFTMGRYYSESFNILLSSLTASSLVMKSGSGLECSMVWRLSLSHIYKRHSM